LRRIVLRGRRAGGGAPHLCALLLNDPTAIVVASISQIQNYNMPAFVRDDYAASYAGARFVESMAFVRNYPADLRVLREP
jgi:hypothetical protein